MTKMTEALDQPSKILLREQGAALVLEYSDGIRNELAAEYLRISSPSAEVQGHGGQGGELPTGKEQVKITGIERAGNYALRLTYSDSHDSGIYTWIYLKQLIKEKEQRWQNYLIELRKMGLSREPEVQVVRFMEPPLS